jgi:hypothetical protein
MKSYQRYYLITGGIIVLSVVAFFYHAITNPSPTNNYGQENSAVQTAQPQITNQQTAAMEASIKTMLVNAYTKEIPFQGSTPFPQNTIRDVTVALQPSGGYDVHVDMNAAPNSQAVGGDQDLIYETLYKTNTFGISNLSVSEDQDIQDNYGNTKNVAFITTSLDSDVADKINWNPGNGGFGINGDALEMNVILQESLNCTPYYTDYCGNRPPAVE